MTDFIADADCWVVLTERVELVPVRAGQQFTSSQVCEVFDVKGDAEARMVDLDADWTPDELWPEAD